MACGVRDGDAYFWFGVFVEGFFGYIYREIRGGMLG